MHWNILDDRLITLYECINIPQLTHVRHIKDRSFLTRVQVRLQHSLLVLNGHLPTGKRHHLGTNIYVKLVQRGAQQLLTTFIRKKLQVNAVFPEFWSEISKFATKSKILHN
jgi:hypothetical protein